MLCQAGRNRANASLLDRFDLAPERGERSPTELTEHVDVAVLTRHPVGPELAEHEAPVAFERGDRSGDPFVRGAPNRRATSAVTNGPWVRAYLPDEFLQRSGDRLGERHRQPEGQRTAERVAVAGGVLSRRRIEPRRRPRSRSPASRSTSCRAIAGPGPCRARTVRRRGASRSAGCAGIVRVTIDVGPGSFAAQVDLGERQVADRRSTSCSSSTDRARRPSARHCSSSSTSASTSASRSSRSSSAPSRSRSRSRSSASAAARRSASGASPSYM